MRVCEVIVFVCLFAKFFCDDNLGVPSNSIELCFGCVKDTLECTIKRCDCNNSPKIRFTVNKSDYDENNITKMVLQDGENRKFVKFNERFYLDVSNDSYGLEKFSPSEYSEPSSDQMRPSSDQIIIPSSDQKRPSIDQKRPPPVPPPRPPPGPPPDNRRPPPDTIGPPPENLRPRLYCRESDFMIVVWNASITENTFYYIRYYNPRGNGMCFETELTRCNFMKIKYLSPYTYYTVELRSFSIDSSSHEAVHRRSDPVNLWTRDIVTYPNPVSLFWLDKWILEDNKYTATVRWRQGRDMPCYFNMVYFPENGDYQEIDLDEPATNRIYNITGLEFGTYYPIAIAPYTISTYGSPIEGPKTWLNITTPSCIDTYNQIEVCTPETPKDLIVREFMNVKARNRYTVFMEWIKPRFVPQYYTAHLRMIGSNSTEILYNISGDSTNVTFTDIPLTTQYEALLVAYSKKGPSSPAVIHRSIIMANKTIIEEEPVDSLQFILIIICPLIILFIMILFMLNHCLTKKMRKQERNKYFKNLIKQPTPSTITTISSVTINDLKADEWELNLDRLVIKEVLGNGAFGVVRKGWLSVGNDQKIEVAIKMLRENPTHDEIKQFYQEIEIMKSVPIHPHLVSLIGCVTKKQLLLIVEYCSKGDLQTFLRRASDKILKATLKMEVNEYEKAKYVFNKMYDLTEIDLEDIPQPKDLISIARQVCIGMEYLASLKLIHRDLAARNVLMTENNIVKISDFGLSRDVYYDNIYYKASAGKLPIRWMALESMTHQIYTTQSDVWSFGILLWEIVTIGGTPYPGLPTHDILGMLKNGYRMRKPENCSDELYSIMTKCWETQPSDRPTFTELKKSLDQILASFTNYLNLDTKIDQKEIEDYIER